MDQEKMSDPNDLRNDEPRGFICGAWKTVREYDGLYVMRCDRPRGHKGYHVDKVLLTNWDGPTPKELPLNVRLADV